MALFDRLRGKPTPEQFARDLIKGIKEAGETAELRFDPEAFCIHRIVDGEPSGGIGLANMFPTYLATPAKDRAAYLRICVGSAMAGHRETPADLEEARPNLRPRLWSRLAFEGARLKAKFGKGGIDLGDMPSVPVGEHLVATMAYDWPDTVASVNQASLDSWGLTLYEALEIGLENLQGSTEGYAQVGDGFYTFVAGDSYDATRILLTGFIERMDVKGSHVALAAGRDALMVTGSEDEAGLAMMAGLTQSVLSEPYALSGSPMILRDGAWEDWLPDGAARQPFLDIRREWLGPVYDGQKELLEQLDARDGVDRFIANLTLVETKNGRRVTYCVWGEGVEMLLPEVDNVVIIAESQEVVAIGPWDRVREVAGHRMEATECYPPRWMVRSFPSPAEIEAIGMGEM